MRLDVAVTVGHRHQDDLAIESFGGNDIKFSKLDGDVETVLDDSCRASEG